MNQEQEFIKPGVVRYRKPINRKTKKHIVFDPEARREFLTGFHKRKLQRKKKAIQELETQLKEERKRIKQEARESYKRLVVSHRPIPEVEHLLTENYDIDNHSVTITELSTADLAEKNNWIGINKVQYEEDEQIGSDSEDENKETEVPGMELKSSKDIKRIIKKEATKNVKKSKVFQLKNKLERQKNIKKAKQEKRKQVKHAKQNKKGKMKRKHK